MPACCLLSLIRFDNQLAVVVPYLPTRRFETTYNSSKGTKKLVSRSFDPPFIWQNPSLATGGCTLRRTDPEVFFGKVDLLQCTCMRISQRILDDYQISRQPRTPPPVVFFDEEFDNTLHRMKKRIPQIHLEDFQMLMLRRKSLEVFFGGEFDNPLQWIYNRIPRKFLEGFQMLRQRKTTSKSSLMKNLTTHSSGYTTEFPKKFLKTFKY